MGIKTFLVASQIVSSLFLVALVLLQGGGAGLSSSYSNFANYYSSKRGFDKMVFHATIVFAVFFGVASFLIIVL